MLEVQNRQMLAQNETLEMLARDVESLKLRVDGVSSDSAKDERIRMLELELEAARS